MINNKAHHDVSHFVKMSLFEHMKDYGYCFIIGVFDDKEKVNEARVKMKQYTSVQCTNTSERIFTITKNNRDKVTGILKIA